MGNAMKTQTTETEIENRTAFIDQVLKAADNDMLVVLHDYPSPDISEPIFRTGEKLKVLSEEGCWWKVRSVVTGNENYIPNNHVAKVYHGWLFEGVARHKAEELLQLPSNRVGSFMIRESKTERGVYSLSVRHRTIKHYRIFRLPNNWYYISPRLTFQCLEDLVNHYSEMADGLCCILTSPCLTFSNNNLNLANQPPPVVMRRNNFDWNNVERSELIDQSAAPHRENRDSLISFGVRNSLASYLSLSSTGKTSQKNSRKKKSKSVYAVPDSEHNDFPIEEEYYEEQI
ncbi:src-like-adapter [Lepisosteus oculatus]|uniref:Src-like-adapter n=1 Tax=Lepisosteus oculatus TaxID=7918 RepID=W5MKF7_LEPOC|nr:PREDICTED: src-like-adapter [Lepisosteus oculatus]